MREFDASGGAERSNAGGVALAVSTGLDSQSLFTAPTSTPPWPTQASLSRNTPNSARTSAHVKRCKVSPVWDPDAVVGNIQSNRAFPWLGLPRARVQRAMGGVR